MDPDPSPQEPVAGVAAEALGRQPVSDRLGDLSGDLRQTAARGTVINAGFLTGLQTLNLVKGLVVAAFLTTTDYGVWGLLAVSIGTLGFLKQVGVGDKYVQQDEPDQELAFQKAFTLELVLDLMLVVVVVATLPAFALLYGESEIVAPGLLMALAIPAVALQAPLWILYRRMRFARQRVLQSVDPIVSFVVTIALAAAGAGYWSLIIGLVAGTWVAAIVAVAFSPYKLALRYDRGTLREYASFSWPLFGAQVGGIAISLLTVIVGQAELGVAGVGLLTIATTIGVYAEKVDGIITETLYPAICAVRDRTELLAESFVKSNRLAMMWGVPFGLALALFAPDLVDFVIGDRWQPAVGLIQAYGLIAAANQVGFNWNAYFMARGETRPVLVVTAAVFVVFVVVALPLLVSEGLDGLAIGMCVVTATLLAGRAYYLRRLFHGFSIVTHTARALAPSVPAVAVVLAARSLENGERTGTTAVAELVLYLAVTITATALLERALLREAVGYLRR